MKSCLLCKKDIIAYTPAYRTRLRQCKTLKADETTSTMQQHSSDPCGQPGAGSEGLLSSDASIELSPIRQQNCACARSARNILRIRYAHRYHRFLFLPRFFTACIGLCQILPD